MIHTMHKGNTLEIGEVDKIATNYGKDIIKSKNYIDLEYLFYPEKIAITDECNNEWVSIGSFLNYTKRNVKFTYGLKVSDISYIRSSNPITYGGKDFCFECWSYLDETSSDYVCWVETQSSLDINQYSRPGQVNFGKYLRSFYLGLYNSQGAGQDWINLGNNDILNELHHFAMCYTHNDTTIKLYMDGVLQYTKTGFSVERLPRYFYIASQGFNPPAYRFSGTIDEIRISDGTCRYDSNFTPSSVPFTKDNKTIILLHCNS